MEGQKALGFHQTYPNLCSEDEWKSYRFGKTWRWVVDDNVLIFGWTNYLDQMKIRNVALASSWNIYKYIYIFFFFFCITFYFKVYFMVLVIYTCIFVCVYVCMYTVYISKVQGLFIRHILNYTGYNQKWNVNIYQICWEKPPSYSNLITLN